VLLNPVGKNLALLFLLLNLVGVAIESVQTLIHYAALLLLSGDHNLKVFNTDQLQALAFLFLNLARSANMVTALFYGLWLFALGYLVVKSRFLPRVFGILLILDGFCMLAAFLQLCLFPGHEKLLYPVYPVMFVAEFGLALRLLSKGVRVRVPMLAFA
jgi:hypothetical protein